MRIVCLLGSPRESGNSSTIAKRLCDTAVKLGAEVKTSALNTRGSLILNASLKNSPLSP
jgi:multimeric flavodoxin WrbA